VSGLTDANNSTHAPFIAGTNNIWKSTSSASSWASNSPDPLVPGGTGRTAQFNALAFARSDSTCNTYFVGSKGGKLYRTTVGVFRSGDAGATWASFMTGLPNVPVFDLAANATTSSVVAFTHGRGAWKLSP
jgi:hypothetical protein